jgi:hypothetical protein
MRLYFAISTGQSKNNSWTVFSYSIVTHRVARFTNTWSSDLRDGAVSRSGRYMAYVNFYHGGVCANSDTIEVIDLWHRRLAALSIEPSGFDLVSSLRWTSTSELQFEGTIQTESDCRLHAKANGCVIVLRCSRAYLRSKLRSPGR